MAPKYPPIVLPTGCTLESLIPIQQLLHLTAHRNKNQHRIAKWWASFSILRRQLGKLIAALEHPDAAFRVNKIEIEKRVVFLREEIVPRCYLAFSAVVADNQYASLGLMLMGCLAKLNKLISFPKEEEDEEVDDSVKIEKTVSSHVSDGEDFGETVSREELEGSAQKQTGVETPKKIAVSSTKNGGLSVSTSSKRVITETVGMSDGEETKSPAREPATIEKKRKKTVETTVAATNTKTTTSKPSKKKRKKGGDIFDDLFSGLI